MVIVLSLVRPWFVVMRCVTLYGVPADPPDSHTVVTVDEYEDELTVMPGDGSAVKDVMVSDDAGATWRESGPGSSLLT